MVYFSTSNVMQLVVNDHPLRLSIIVGHRCTKSKLELKVRGLSDCLSDSGTIFGV